MARKAHKTLKCTVCLRERDGEEDWIATFEGKFSMSSHLFSLFLQRRRKEGIFQRKGKRQSSLLNTHFL